MSNVPGASAPNPSPTPFERLTAAVASRSLTGAQAAALIAILDQLRLWDELDTPAASEPYRLGLSDRVLAAYRSEMTNLAGEASS